MRELHRNTGTITGLRDAHKQAWRDGWGGAFPAVWRHHVRSATWTKRVSYPRSEASPNSVRAPIGSESAADGSGSVTRNS